ncbi:DUF309 domain-containing protein [Halobacteriales archaeon QH_7_66_36]|nr:MAG: DUF309 domain-containing protein [Halobacteriales archaeon QH_7_66_36]
MDVPLDARLRAGAAVFNAGHYHAAHDAWEPPYRDATGEERDFLQGLIQYAAAAHHGTDGNREGAQGLAESALGYLDGVDSRGIDLDPVRAWLRNCRDDFDAVTGRTPPSLERHSDRPSLSDLTYPAAAVAAPLVAGATGHDAAVLDAGASYALTDLADDEVGSPFVTFVLDFLRGAEQETDDGTRRDIVVQRLGSHVERRQAREDDVTGLFD